MAVQPARKVEFTVLGPLGFTDGAEVAVLQPSKPGALLATLLLNANSAVSVGYLLRAVWGDEAPETAKAAVQTCVLRLRKLFKKYGIAGSAIETLSDGYRINAGPDTLDLLRFRELLRAAPAAPDCEAELALLREALTLWRGRPMLSNVSSALVHRNEVPRIAEEWLRAAERTFEIEMALGRCREVLPELVETAYGHPVHERFWEQLVEALYRTGRRAEALAEYRTVKQHLQEELGIDPGPGLQRLELLVLRGDPDPAPVVPVIVRTSAPDRPASGPDVLQLLLKAGLLERDPEGLYQMNGLLQAMTGAAAQDRRAPGAQHTGTSRSTGE
jgi:DNA-binding SARP family transcriptional activator